MGRFNSALFRRPQFVGGYEPVHEIDSGVYDIDSLHDFLKIVCADVASAPKRTLSTLWKLFPAASMAG